MTSAACERIGLRPESGLFGSGSAGLIASLGLLAAAQPVVADVVLDPGFSSGTVAAGEYAPGQTTDFLIREAYGQRSGSNLYHRFSEFDLDAGQSATFVEDAPGSGITRILSHVNSASPSYLDGTLRSTIPGADLYFFNPRGVVFGPNARLDVLGSFRSSSAQQIRFADDLRFGESLGPPSVTLSSAAPSAWGFLSPSGAAAIPAALTVEGASLVVPNGETLSLVGGPIDIQGPGVRTPSPTPNPSPTLAAPSGRIELVAVASSGEVAIDSAEAADLAGFSEMAGIRLRDGARLETDGSGNESLVVRGDSFELDDSEISANHSGPLDHSGFAVDIRVRNRLRFGDSTIGSIASLESLALRNPGELSGEQGGDGGAVRFEANRVELSGEDGSGGRTLIRVGNSCSSGSCGVGEQPTGAGGRLEIEADTLEIRNGAWLLSESSGPGRGTPIRVDARVVSIGNDADVAPGTPTFVGSGSFGSLAVPPGGPAGGPDDAAGGSIEIVASERLLLENGGQISSQASGSGRGGNIRIETGHFETRVSHPGLRPNGLPITERSLVAALASGESDSGAIEIESSNDIRLDFGEVFTRITGAGQGRPGRLALSAPNGEIELTNGSALTVRSWEGDGRAIDLESDRLVVRDNSIIQSFSEGNGRAGDLDIRVRDILVSGGRNALSPSGLVSRPIGSLVSGTGSSGTIRIDGERLRLEDGALILLSSRESGAAGDLVIGGRAPLLSVELDAARIETDNNASGASGGSVSIRSQRIELANGSRISAVNRDLAQPGRIELEGRDLRVESGSLITSGSDGLIGVGGDIEIRMSESSLFHEARVTTDAAGADPMNQGGSISLRSEILILAASTIEADAPAGAGGNIEIVAGRFVESADSGISASGSSPALAGVVRVVSSDTNTVESVAREPRAIEDVSQRLATGCDSRTDAQGSLFLLPRPVRPPPGEFGPWTTATSTADAISCGRAP